MIRPATIIMTATITPAAGMPGTKRSDPAVRRAEYLEAFGFYLSMEDDVVDHVVLLENSGDDLSSFREVADRRGHRKKVTLVPCSSDYPSDRGKGYGEFMMLDAGVEQLAREGRVLAETHMWKVTGRLKVRNLDLLVRRCDPDAEVCCDLRSVPLVKERLGGNEWMELRVFSFTLSTYRSLFKGHFGDGFVLEKAFFSKVRTAHEAGQIRIQPRFPVQPLIEGVSGFSDRSYSSTSYQIKGALRSVVRRVLPSLWL